MNEKIVDFELVKNDLEDRGFILPKLSEVLGITRSGVYAMAKKGNCSVLHLLKICNFLGQPITRYIIGSENEEYQTPESENLSEVKDGFESKYYDLILENYHLGKEQISILKDKIAMLESKLKEQD